MKNNKIIFIIIGIAISIVIILVIFLLIIPTQYSKQESLTTEKETVTKETNENLIEETTSKESKEETVKETETSKDTKAVEETQATTAEEQKLENKLVRKEVSFNEVNQGRLMIVLTFGQSQAANYGETKYSSKENVYNYYNGKFYTAVDPLLGTTGKRGSVWTRLGDKIIEQGLYDNVLFVPIAVGASGIESWSPDGNLYHWITDAIDGLRKYKLEITHMFWSQGSYDSWQHTPEAAEEYKAEFMEMVDGIRKYGVTAPIYVSIETYSYGNSDPYIQQAQRHLVNIDAKIYPGPNNDEIKERWDGVHFSNKGLDKLANLWFEIIKEYN